MKCTMFLNSKTEDLILISVSDLAQEFTLLLLDSGLVPHRDLQHALSEVPSVNMGIYKSLIPLGFSALLHRFGPSFTLVARKRMQTHAEHNRKGVKWCTRFKPLHSVLKGNTNTCIVQAYCTFGQAESTS